MKARFWCLLGAALVSGLFALPAQADNYYGSLEAENASLRARISELERSLSDGGGSCCGGHNGCCDAGCCKVTPANWFDCECCDPTIAAFITGDGWSDLNDATDDLGTPNNFGNRFGIEGTALLGSSGVRGHAGASYGIYDYHGRRRNSSAEEQIFVTVGAYHRACGCCDDVWTWGVALDYLHDDSYGSRSFVGREIGQAIDIAQIRFLVGYMTNPCNEFGVWGTFGVEEDAYFNDFFGVLGEVGAQDQLNAYWRRYWDFGGETMVYVGVADPSAEGVGFNQGNDYSEWVVGIRGIAPLTCNLGLIGGFHYVIPTASGAGQTPTLASHEEESWNVTFGVIFVRGCNLPVLPTADNGWFTKQFDAIPQ